MIRSLEPALKLDSVGKPRQTEVSDDKRVTKPATRKVMSRREFLMLVLLGPATTDSCREGR